MRRVSAAAAVAVLVLGSGVLGSGTAASATPGPPDAPEYWFDSWHVQSLWDSGARGQGVTIGEIDTGVAELPELDGRVLSGTDFGDGGGNGRTDREIDAFGHGTAMASIMVAKPGLLSITGLAPDAKILPIAIPLNGTTDAQESDHLPQAIRYAADHGAKIISMSLGGKRTQGTVDQACSADEQAAIYHALDRGAIVTAAIGNSGRASNSVEDPAVCLGVVSVGAIDESGTVASFSTRQPFLTLVAPGVDVPSLGRIAGEAYSGDGTSQATAITSAALALVWSKYPKLTGPQVVARVLATLDGHRSTPSSAYGYGALDAYRAVTGKVAADAPNPVENAVAPFLGRSAALAKSASAARPAPVRGVGDTGGYSVGGRPRFDSPQVLRGALLGAAGLLVLLVLGVGGLVSRRRRAVAAAAGPGPYPGWPVGAPPPGPAPSGPAPAEERRPSPRPRPSPDVTWRPNPAQSAGGGRQSGETGTDD